MHKSNFISYIFATNKEGSGKAASYVKALDWLVEMIKCNDNGFVDCRMVWSVSSADRIHDLYLRVLDEARLGDASSWNIDGIPKSYLQSGYCSAALKVYESYLREHSVQQSLYDRFVTFGGEATDLAGELADKIEQLDYEQITLGGQQGEDAVRSVKTRLNQTVFRRMILDIYDHRCCITLLDIPEVNRASHIIPWAVDKATRLDPQNGLCLSATYDAAFDRNLISLDDDYRVIVSNNIRDHYSSDSVKHYFLALHGQQISLPKKFYPDKKYLSSHRSKGEF